MGNSWRERIFHFNKRRLGLATGWPSRAPTGPKSGLLRPSRPRRSWVRSGPHRLARQDYLSVLGTACRWVRVAHEALQRAGGHEGFIPNSARPSNGAWQAVPKPVTSPADASDYQRVNMPSAVCAPEVTGRCGSRLTNRARGVVTTVRIGQSSMSWEDSHFARVGASPTLGRRGVFWPNCRENIRSCTRPTEKRATTSTTHPPRPHSSKNSPLPFPTAAPVRLVHDHMAAAPCGGALGPGQGAGALAPGHW